MCKPKPKEIVEKHTDALKGTPFEGCASCPATRGRVSENGKMFCSNVPPNGGYVTENQARGCKYGVPPLLISVKELPFGLAPKIDIWRQKHAVAEAKGRESARRHKAASLD